LGSRVARQRILPSPLFAEPASKMSFVDITAFFPPDPPAAADGSNDAGGEGAGAGDGFEDSGPAGVELPCESYLYDFCRSIENIDFATARARPHDGAGAAGTAPTIRGKVAWRSTAVRCADEWCLARRVAATAHVKYTLPGPMTIISKTRNEHYGGERELAEDLAAVINTQVRELVSAGCRSIHIEEPALEQEFERARVWGIEAVGRCLEGVAGGCEFSIYSGCGSHTSFDGEHLKLYLHEFARMAQAFQSLRSSSSVFSL